MSKNSILPLLRTLVRIPRIGAVSSRVNIRTRYTPLNPRLHAQDEKGTPTSTFSSPFVLVLVVLGLALKVADFKMLRFGQIPLLILQPVHAKISRLGWQLGCLMKTGETLIVLSG